MGRTTIYKKFADIIFLHTPTVFIVDRATLNKDIQGTIYFRTSNILYRYSLPTEPIRLTTWETLTDLPQFIDSHPKTLKANKGNPTFIAALKRLLQLKNIIKS